KERLNIIAEIKRSSPSKGVINDSIDIRKLARDYEAGGAAAISVLTESEYFGGSIDDLKIVRATTGLPILRKDFNIDEYQVYDARNLIRERPDDALMVAESALSTKAEVDQLRELGFDGFLIGEMLMKSPDPAAALRLLAQGVPA